MVLSSGKIINRNYSNFTLGDAPAYTLHLDGTHETYGLIEVSDGVEVVLLLYRCRCRRLCCTSLTNVFVREVLFYSCESVFLSVFVFIAKINQKGS